MAAQWEAWAKRTHALPWPWKPQYGQKLEENGSQAKVFDLKQGDDLPRDKAPNIAGRGFTITATVKSEKPDGVIVAQGGTNHGFALYLKDGKLTMAVRRNGNLTNVAAPDKLPQGEAQVAASLKKNGEITLSVAGKVVASGKAPGPLTQMPQDGLQVGDDLNGLVGEYQGATKFSGLIQNVRIELSD
ncbi:MAG: laminin G domain-containing protein [Candidatus Sumerlaeota bacterium]|nr:laminin G domain-containing protein [Candidatus Sumerlaeota bacterium]